VSHGDGSQDTISIGVRVYGEGSAEMGGGASPALWLEEHHFSLVMVQHQTKVLEPVTDLPHVAVCKISSGRERGPCSIDGSVINIKNEVTVIPVFCTAEKRGSIQCREQWRVGGALWCPRFCSKRRVSGRIKREANCSLAHEGDRPPDQSLFIVMPAIVLNFLGFYEGIINE
jgi:hypothetical protein